MEISKNDLPKSRQKVSVNLTETEVAEFFVEALKHLGSHAKISGFRPGKAPEHILKQQIDPDAVREEAYSLAVRSAWTKLLSNKAVAPIEDPQVQVENFEEGKAGELTFEFDIKPVVKVKAWQGIKVKTKQKIEVKQDDIDEVLESLRLAHASEVLKIDPASSGDKVQVSFEGKLAGKKLDKLSATNFPVVLGQKTSIPGFEEQILGMKKGETKDFSLTFPREHQDPDVAGKKVDFSLTIQEVFQLNLPEVTDEFAKKFEQPNKNALLETVKKDLTEHKEGELLTQQKAEWLSQFDKKIEVEVPESLIVGEIERSKKAWTDFLLERSLGQKDWLERRGTTIEKMEEDWCKAGQSSVRIGLGLATIATEQGKILSSNEEFQQFLEEVVKQAVVKR